MDVYMNEQNFNDPNTSNAMLKIIRSIVKQELASLKFDKTYPAKVMSVNENTASIKIMDSDTAITGVKNKTGETLSANDEVLIEAMNNSLNNIVIKYKK